PDSAHGARRALPRATAPGCCSGAVGRRPVRGGATACNIPARSGPPSRPTTDPRATEGDDATLAAAGPEHRSAERLDLRRDPLADARDDRGGRVQRAGPLREPVDGRATRAERAVRPPVVHVQPGLPARSGVRAEP